MTAKEQIDQAKNTLEQLKVAAETVILILTAEQALKAQRVVRNAGRGRKWTLSH